MRLLTSAHAECDSGIVVTGENCSAVQLKQNVLLELVLLTVTTFFRGARHAVVARFYNERHLQDCEGRGTMLLLDLQNLVVDWVILHIYSLRCFKNFCAIVTCFSTQCQDYFWRRQKTRWYLFGFVNSAPKLVPVHEAVAQVKCFTQAIMQMSQRLAFDLDRMRTYFATALLPGRSISFVRITNYYRPGGFYCIESSYN